jgi:hypothetical protein
MTRWEALVRYDPEIKAAALQLMPFGSAWVDRLGEAFTVLNEDRKYLPIEAQSVGFTLTLKEDGTIDASRDSLGTTSLRSNADILRFGKWAFKPTTPDGPQLLRF